MHRLAEQLLKTIRKQESIRAGDRMAVAVSGGADSVALLRLLLDLRGELGIVLSVAHVNHKLRGDASEQDEKFVAELARRHGVEFHLQQSPVDAASSGIEAAARDLRYAFFYELAQKNRVTKIATAHTIDDQAETVLLRIFRGTGIRGLSGIHPRIVFEKEGRMIGEVVRPLLGVRRAELLAYLREIGQDWREDSSNQNVDFLRNRVRHRLLPVITEEFGDAVIERLSELAEIARAEEEQYSVPTTQSASLDLGNLLALPLAAQRRLVRAWIEANAPDAGISFRAIEEVLALACAANGKKLELSSGWNVRRKQQELVLERNPPRGRDATGDQDNYQYVLHVPGAVEVPELAARIEATFVNPSAVPEEERSHLLAAERMPRQITIRNWRRGDCFWPSHTKSEKKVKELLADRHATGAEKRLWPVAAAEDGKIVWMRGFAVPAALRAADGSSQAICIREIAGLM